MASVDDISQLCRLCLVKEQVNIPIFGENSDIAQTFVKINSCLPVKVSQDDNLPKKICDGCSYKLDMLYIFRNTSVVSEKQLITWLNQAGLSTIPQTAVKDPLATTKPEIMVKQETFDATDTRGEGENSEIGVDTQSYLMQQQQLPYQQDFEFGDEDGSSAEVTDEPAPKRAKRAVTLKSAPVDETEELDDDLDAAMQITKAEEEDSDDLDQPDYVEAPITSADDQPGPSGVGKAAVEAPFLRAILESPHLKTVKKTLNGENGRKLKNSVVKDKSKSHSEKRHQCNFCDEKFFSTITKDIHMANAHLRRREFQCIKCKKRFNTTADLKTHEKFYCTPAFICDLCGKGFFLSASFRNHKRYVHDNITYTCEVCKKVFKCRSKYMDHLKLWKHYPWNIESSLKLKCELCNKFFLEEQQLREHVVVHVKVEEPRLCFICGKMYKTMRRWRAHKNDHYRKIMCDRCGLIFKQDSSFQRHYRIHTGERPYKCHICEKTFRQGSILKGHLRVHTGEKPYQCELCKKRYSCSANLKTHLCKGYVE